MGSKAYTKEKVREQFLNQLHGLVDYWANIDAVERSTQERMEGLVFSILNVFDGTAMNLPSLDIVIRPHPEDMKYHIDNDEDYYEDGQCINDDVYLHYMWHKKEGN